MRRLGFIDTSVAEKPSFAGHTFPAGDYTQLPITYTYAGDANLDGQADMSDLSALATHWQSTSDWLGGDFDYNGIVDVTDLGLLASNWQAGVTATAKPTDGYPWAFADAFEALGLPNVTVPEPATTTLLGALGLMLRNRHRRRAKNSFFS